MRSGFITVLLTRMALAFVFLIGIIICWVWYPLDAWISSGMPFMDYNETEITLEMNIVYHTMLFFYRILSLPCFAIVIMGFIDTFFARKYGTFNTKSANILFKMALILFISSVIYIIGNIIFMFLGWHRSTLYFNSKPGFSLGVLYFVIGVIGLILSTGLYAAHKYIARGITAEKNNGL